MTKKVVRFFKKKLGDTDAHQLPPQVSPTLVTPLGAGANLRRNCNALLSTHDRCCPVSVITHEN